MEFGDLMPRNLIAWNIEFNLKSVELKLMFGSDIRISD